MSYVGGPWYFMSHASTAILRRIAGAFSTAIHRRALASVGPGSYFQCGVRFAQPSIVRVGVGCYFWSGVGCAADYPGERLDIGDRVQLNARVHLDTTGGLTIGDDVLISEDAVVYTHDHGLDPHSTPVGLSKTIEAGAWIGMRAIIMPNCRRIGRNAVIGANSVVCHDVPDNAIVAGVPARIVRLREDCESKV